jgi:hypothetical protein
MKNLKRTSLTELRPKHFATGESIAHRKHYDRTSQHEFMMERYANIFGGGLRRKKLDEVPSDELRKWVMIYRLLDWVEERRAEIEADRARRASA